MKESYLMRHVVYLLPKGSPLTAQISNFIFKMTDSGIFRKYFKDEMDKVKLISKEEKITTGVSLNLSDMQGVFLLFCLMNLGALCLFILEYFIFSCTSSKIF